MARKCRNCKVEIPAIKLSDNWQKAGFCAKGCKYSYKPKAKQKKPKVKVKSLAALLEDAAKSCQKFVRLQSADENGMCKCWTCGVSKHWQDMQGGHFIERGKKATKIDETNVHPQCRQCNQWGMKNTSTVLAYREAMIEYYGADYVEKLIDRSKKPFKPTRDWIQEQKQYFDNQIEYHLERINGA